MSVSVSDVVGVAVDVSAIVVLTNAFAVMRVSAYSDVATDDVVDEFIATVIGAVKFEDDIVVDVISEEVVSLVVSATVIVEFPTVITVVDTEIVSNSVSV